MIDAVLDALLQHKHYHEAFLRQFAAAGGEGLERILDGAVEAIYEDDNAASGDGGYPSDEEKEKEDDDDDGYDDGYDDDAHTPSESGSSDTALSDSEVEEAIRYFQHEHAERQVLRRKIRDGAAPDSISMDFTKALADERRYREEDEETEDEDEDEAEDQAEAAEWMLKSAQDELDKLAYENAQKSPLDDVVREPVLRPRLNIEEATPDEIEAELEVIEEQIVELEGESERKDALWETMRGVRDTYEELRFEGGPGTDEWTDPRLAAGDAAVLTATELLDPGDFHLFDTTSARDTICALRAGLEAVEAAALVLGRPSLKRKLAEREAVLEIRTEQLSTATIIDERAFTKLVREIAHDYRTDSEFTPDAIAAFQAATEDHLVEHFRAANRAAIHAKRTEIWPRDMQLVLAIRGEQSNH
jgi:histone H3/H4